MSLYKLEEDRGNSFIAYIPSQVSLFLHVDKWIGCSTSVSESSWRSESSHSWRCFKGITNLANFFAVEPFLIVHIELCVAFVINYFLIVVQLFLVDSVPGECSYQLVSASVRHVILDAKVGPPSYGKGLAENILAVVSLPFILWYSLSLSWIISIRCVNWTTILILWWSVWKYSFSLN